MSKPKPVDWDRIRTAREAEVESLRGLRLSEVTPSRRDFTRFVGAGRQEVGVIATLRRRDPWSGRTWADLDVATAAAALDDSEAVALAVTTEPLFHDGRLSDLSAAAEAATAAVLRDEPIVDPLQVYHSRMHGGDACVFPAAWVSPPVAAEIVRTASTLHMAAIAAVFAARDLEAALRHDKIAIGVWTDGEQGGIDFALLDQISRAIPPQRTALLLSDTAEPEDFRRLSGLVDGALVARPFMDGSPPEDVLRRLRDG